MSNLIQGAKKGGGGGRTPKEDPDSLRSNQTAQILDLLGWGPIRGLVDGFRSIFFDGVPLQNADGSFNFEGVSIGMTLGTQGQAALPGFDTVQNEIAVGMPVRNGSPGPVVRTITSPDVDSCRVTIAVPQISFQDPKNGDLKGDRFTYAIDVQSDGGGFVELLQDTVDGKTTTTYKRSKKFDLRQFGPAPYDIRVRRISPDSTESNRVNAFSWESYTEIQSLKLRLPMMGTVGYLANAQQFPRIPGRVVDLFALEMSVPSNYDPVTRTYTGIWNGLFVIDWTDCPPWHLYALLTNPDYGLGQDIDASNVDKWSLYRIAQYCDEMVPDGFGGTEPRFTSNLVLNTPEDATKVLRDVAAIFRGMVYWGNSLVNVTQDAPSDPVAQYTRANTVDPYFNYESTSDTTSSNSVCIVYWNDASQLGKRIPEVVVRPDLVRRYGLRLMELAPIGTWSRGQAHRLGLWALYSQEEEDEVVTFRTGMEGVLARPGQVFKIADPAVSGERLAGRISAATTTEVTLDSAVTLQAGEDYTLSVARPDPDKPLALLTEKRTVTTAPGTVTVLTVTPAFSAAPQRETIWMLESDAVAATTWRCLTAKPVDDSSGKSKQVEIIGVAHNPTKYPHIEAGKPLEELPVSRLTDRVYSPAALHAVETFYASNGIRKSRLDVSWVAPQPLQRYVVAWREDGGPWQNSGELTGTTWTLDNLQPCKVEIEVRATNSIGNISWPPARETKEILGKTAKPPIFDFFNVSVQPDGTRVWDWGYTVTPRPIDLAGAELRYILGTLGPGIDWDSMTPLLTRDGSYPTAPFENNQLAAGSYTLAVRAVDDSGNLSDGILSMEIELPDPRRANLILDEYPHRMGWPGTKVDCVAVGTTLEALDSTTTWDTLPDTWDAWNRWAVAPAASFTYTHTVVDIGLVTTFRALVTPRGDGVFVVEQSVSLDGTTWSAWEPAGTPSPGRYLQIRVAVASSLDAPFAVLRELDIFLDGKITTDYVNDLDISTLASPYRIGVGEFRVPISKPYAQNGIREVSVTFQSLTEAGWKESVDDKTSSDAASIGPLIRIYHDNVLADPPPIDVKVAGILA